jgi:integrase/recombinase XerD
MSREPRDGAGIAPRRPCRPLALWPALDQAAWTLALTPGDPFDPGGLGAGWAVPSRRRIASAYGTWLAWLDGQGLLDPSAAPASRATRDLVRIYAKDLQTSHSPFYVQGSVQHLGDALRVMTPDRDLRWITRGAWRLRNRAVPVRDKRARLQSPKRLVALGVRLMEVAEAEAVSLESAMTFRDGLVIAFLAYRPLRAKNLTMISCDQHLIRRGDGWWVAFIGKEMKAKRPLEFPFPAALAPHLEKYLEIYRPVLLTAGGRQPPAAVSRLWISRDATALGQKTIAHHIKRRTRAEFGIELNPHGFRDAAATYIALYDPEHVQIVAAILGHSTLETSQKYYDLSGTVEAGRRYHGAIKAIRSRAKATGEQVRRGRTRDRRGSAP